MPELSYTIILEPAEEGGYNVSVPALPGCFTQGDTYDDAVEMAKDAIRMWVDALLEDGIPVPMEPSPAAVRITNVRIPSPVHP